MAVVHIDKTVEQLQAEIDAKNADAERWLTNFRDQLIQQGDTYAGRGYPGVVDEFLEERGFPVPDRPRLFIVPTHVTVVMDLTTNVTAMNAEEAAQRVRDGNEGDINIRAEVVNRLNYPRDYTEDQRGTFTHEVNEEEVTRKPARRR